MLEEKAHFMTFKQAYEYMGITSRNTSHLKTIVQSIAQVQVEWDFLGEEGNYCRKQKEAARHNLNEAKNNPRFQKIVRSHYFQKLETDLITLQAQTKPQQRQIRALIEKQLDALFPEFTVASVFEEASIHSGGLLSYAFNMKTAFRLCDPLLYAKVDLATMRNFKKKGAFKLYENGCRYLRVGKSPWLTMELAKKLLGVEKTSSGQFAYPEYATFRQGVIDPAIKEINRFYQEGRCQFSVNYRIRKTGRKVTHIQFIFVTLRGAVAEHLTQLMEEKGVNRTLAKELAGQYSPEYTKAQLQYVNERSQQVGFKFSQQGGYLVDAMRKNFAAYEPNKSTDLTASKALHASSKMLNLQDNAIERTNISHMSITLACAEDLFEVSSLLKGLWLGFVPAHLRERTIQLGAKWQVREVRGLLKQYVPDALQADVESAFRGLFAATNVSESVNEK
ncbi:MAG: replication initiation protein [Gammaproteobacteria bacterium]